MQYEKELEEYERYLREKESSVETRELCLRQANRFWQFVQGRKLDKERILLHKKRVEQNNMSVSTRNICIVSTNSYLRYLVYDRYVMKTQKLQKRCRLNCALEEADYYCLLKCARKSGRKKYYYIMKTLVMTGIRVSELK